MSHEFAEDWTYRTPLVTIQYPKGHKTNLDPETLVAARKVRVLVTPARRPGKVAK